MSLAGLPAELLLQIIEPLKRQDLLALTRQCHRLYQIVNPLLWRRNANWGLLRAATIGHVKVVQKFLEIGANPYHRATSSNKTALTLAAAGGHAEVIDTLLHHVADAWALTRYDTSAFQTAIRSGHAETVEVFLQHGIKDFAICDSAYYLLQCSPSIARRVRKYALPLLSKIGNELSRHQLDCVSILLCTAAADGDIEDAKTCAELYPGVLRGNPNLKHLAMSVSDSGSMAMLDFCVGLGLDPGMAGGSLMYIALRSGNLEMARCLHGHGARLGGGTGRFAPAHGACASRKVEILDFALELGADTLQDYPAPNSTALHHAIDSWQPDPIGRVHKNSPSPSISMLQRLLEMGADVNSLSRKSRTPLHFAAGNGWVEGTKLLLEHGAVVDKADVNNSTALRRAIDAETSSAEVLKVLLEHGASPEGLVEGAKVTSDYGPLHWAISRDNFEAIPILLDAGASVTRACGSGSDQPLHVAINRLWRGYTKPRLATVKLLLERGAPFNPGGTWPPIVRALVLKEEECLRTFLECGADIHTTINGDVGLLHHACEARFGSSTRFLLESGVDPNRRDRNGWTPLHRAVYTRPGIGGEEYYYYGYDDAVVSQTTIVRYLIEFGADPNSKGAGDMTPLHLVVSAKTYDTAQLLLTLGCSVNAKTSGGKTPLHVAVKKRSKRLVQLLLDHGADVNISTNSGKTVLHMAVSTNDDDIVAIILDRNPDVNKKDQRGKTALIMAASRGRSKAVEMLLERSVDIHVSDRTGRSALEWAETRDHGVTAQMLRNAARSSQ